MSAPARGNGRPPVVLHVVPSLELGGAPRIVLDLLRVQRARGRYTPRLVVLRRRELDHPGYDPPGDTVYLGFSGRYRNVPAAWACARALRRLVIRSGAAIVNSHLWMADAVSAAAVAGTGARQLVYVVDLGAVYDRRRLRRRPARALTLRLLRRAGARFAAISADTREGFCRRAGWPPDGVRVIPNGIDPAPFAAAPRPRPRAAGEGWTAGAACRLIEGKGVQVLLDALHRLPPAARPAVCRVAGEGAHRPALERRARALGLEDVVAFTGTVSDMPGFLRACDVFAVPSLESEGLPGTILEAMASGCAVVASDCGGAREAVEDGVTGRMVPVADAGALAGALAGLAGDPARLAALGAAARRRVAERFTLERMADAFEAYYDEVAGGGGP